MAIRTGATQVVIPGHLVGPRTQQAARRLARGLSVGDRGLAVYEDVPDADGVLVLVCRPYSRRLDQCWDATPRRSWQSPVVPGPHVHHPYLLSRRQCFGGHSQRVSLPNDTRFV